MNYHVGGNNVQRHRRRGLTALSAVAVVAALAAAGCSSSSSSSSSSAPAGSSATSSASSPAQGAGTGGQGAQSVTNYLTYTGGKAGAANSSLAPVVIGYVNEQGDANPPGALASVGAQMAVTYINQQLGGVDGHPLKLDTCFTTTEEQGTTCADQFLANKSVKVVATGGVAVGAQSFFNTLGTKLPVIDGVAATTYDTVDPDAVILFGDVTHVLAPFGTYATQVLHAKTASVIYPQTPGLIPGAQAIEAGLKAAGVQVTMEGYPVSETDLASVLAAAHASTADMIVPYADATDCVNLAKALVAQGITDAKKIVSAPLCLSGQVIAGLGDFPKWTYAIASSLFGDTTDPGMPAYEAVAGKYTTAGNAPDPWMIVDFGQLLTIDKLLNQIGYSHITSAAILAAAKAFKGPQALGAPALDCGKYPSAPAVCNDRIQFFQYNGNHVFVKVAGWLQPPS
jgi:branched-chain amino acid transport system substrate-binding protein